MESRAGKVAEDQVAATHLSIFVRVCVTEAESMATAAALSRSPLYVRGGHLHAFEKLFVAHSTSTRSYNLSCSLAHSGGLIGQDCWWRGGIREWGFVMASWEGAAK